MGYTTTFEGCLNIEPPLSAKEVEFLEKFSQTRRMNREKGAYYVEGSDYMGQGRDSDIIDCNTPPEGQPGLWCKWVPESDGSCIVWDGSEKFYHADSWMVYLIENFLKPDAIAKEELTFLQGHMCNGEFIAYGEEPTDIWKLDITDNKVTVTHGEVVFK